MSIRNLLSVFSLFVVVFLTQSCVRSKASLMTKKYAPEALQRDAAILKDVILQMHPAVGVYKPRSYYESLFKDYLSSIKDSLTEREFRIKTKLVLDELHCGHTEVLYSKELYKQVKPMKFNFSPYIFLPVNDKAYMIANLNKKQDSVIRKGAEIVSINGVPVDSMLRYSKRFISADGYSFSGKNHFVQLGFNNYYPSLFGRPDTFTVQYMEGREKKSLSYPAIKLKTLPMLPLGAKDDSLYKKFRRAKIKYRYLDDDKETMVLRIEKFSHNSDARTYRKIFKKLKNNGTENLVIDLRNNGGGSLANSYRLLSYLVDSSSAQTLRTHVKNYPYRKYTRGNMAFKFTRLAYRIIGTKKTVNDTDHFVYTIKPRKRNHYDKKIIVLLNGGSFSASCLVAAYLKNNKRTIFIGEESGGTIEGCNAGITPYYKLPNTRIRVRVPAFRVLNDLTDKPTGRGIIPDYQIDYTYKDITMRRDLELLKVKELLKIN